MTQLCWRATGDDASLATVLAAAGPVWTSPPIGLASTTSWHGFVRLHDGGLSGWDRTIDLGEVFEARLFVDDVVHGSDTVELRWLHRRAGAGRAVLLAESPEALVGAGAPFRQVQPEEVVDVQSGSLLLWGSTGHPAADGWYLLREHRIGRLPVPCRTPARSDGQNLVLTVCEYIGQDAYGNAYVIDERLLGLVWQPVQPAPEKDTDEQEGAR